MIKFYRINVLYPSYEYLFSSSFTELSVKTTFLNLIISKALKWLISVTLIFGMFLIDFSTFSFDVLSKIISE